MSEGANDRLAGLFAELAASRGMADLWKQVWAEMSPEAKRPFADAISAQMLVLTKGDPQGSLRYVYEALLKEAAVAWFAENRERVMELLSPALEQALKMRVDTIVSTVAKDVGQKQYDDAIEMLRRRREEFTRRTT